MSEVFDLHEDIEVILDYFDFEKCHKVMEFLDWRWFQTNGVPSIGEMRRFARNLINDTVRGLQRETTVTKEYSIECGGFHVSAWQEYPGEKIYITLRFSLTSWGNQD